MPIETRLASVFPPAWEYYVIHKLELLHVTECSKLWHYFAAYYALPTAVQYAAGRGTVLVSAQEQALFRIEAGREDFADRYHLTRTVAVYFREGERFYVAFDDIPDRKQNILLARAHEGHNGHMWILPKKEDHIRGILERAEQSRRIVEIIEDTPSTILEMAILGDIAQPYRTEAEQMRIEYTPKMQLEYYLTKEDNVEVRVVGIGHTPSWDGEVINATGFCYREGLARGIREKKEFIPAIQETPLSPSKENQVQNDIPTYLPEKSPVQHLLCHSKRIKVVPDKQVDFLIKEKYEYCGDFYEEEIFKKIGTFPEEQTILLIKDKNGKYHLFTQ